MVDYYAVDHGIVCKNPQCKSFGKPHPNCKCRDSFAKGGCVGEHLEKCEYYADGGEVESNNKVLNYPQSSLDHTVVQSGLHHLLTKVGQNGKRENPYSHFEDYVEGVKRGHKSVEAQVSKLLSKEKIDVPPRETEDLKSHLDSLEVNPEKALDVGGELASILPDHGAALGAKSASAINYFQSLKPRPSQNGPLDRLIPPSKSQASQYERQLHIAENPMLILKHVKEGTIQPQDLKTLHTLYPSLGQALTGKAAEALIEAKEKKAYLNHHQKRGLSALLGQPLDFIQTPQAMQAIMKANASMPIPEASQKKPKKASGVELKQINKVNQLSATSSQDRQIDQRKV